MDLSMDSPNGLGLLDMDSEGVQMDLDRGLSSPNPSTPITAVKRLILTTVLCSMYKSDQIHGYVALHDTPSIHTVEAFPSAAVATTPSAALPSVYCWNFLGAILFSYNQSISAVVNPRKSGMSGYETRRSTNDAAAKTNAVLAPRSPLSMLYM